MGDFDGLVALVTGGASGIGAATAALLVERGGRVAVLDVGVDDVPSSVLGVVCDVSDGPACVPRWRPWWRTCRPHGRRHQQRRHRRGRRRGRQRRRRVAPGARRERRRDGADRARLRCPTCAVRHAGDREHVLDRGDRRRAQPRSLQRQQGRGALAHARDGGRPRARGHPGQRRRARHRRHPLGRPAARPPPRIPTRMAAALRARQPMGRLVTADEVAHAIAYLARRCRHPRRARSSPSTAASPAPSSSSTRRTQESGRYRARSCPDSWVRRRSQWTWRCTCLRACSMASGVVAKMCRSCARCS
jgi:2-keto-3-deoxy-L-fuconate dehydrogenase